MKRRIKRHCCTYAVGLGGDTSDGDLRSFAHYLSTMRLAGCEVLVLDDSAPARFQERRRVLRWVGRHVAAASQHHDMVHAAFDLAECEKVIVASPEARYTAEEVRAICDLLDRHEVVEPQEYVEPMPWWGGIEAASLLLYRGADQLPQGTTFAFRRSAFRPLRAMVVESGDGRQLLASGLDVHEAPVFVRREPPRLSKWLSRRACEAAMELVVTAKCVFFSALIPLLIVLALIGGMQVAGGYAGVMAFASVLLAMRGRVGAGKYFPLRACLFAPLWIVERSLSVYLALFARLLTRFEIRDSRFGSPESRISNLESRRASDRAFFADETPRHP